MGHGCQSHGCTGMARVGFARHINCQGTDCVDTFPIEFAIRRFRHCGESATITDKSRLFEQLVAHRRQVLRFCGIGKTIEVCVSVVGWSQRGKDGR